MQLAWFEAHQAAEVQALFTRTFSDAEGPAEGELVGGLVRNLMTDTDPRDVLGFVAMDKGRVVAGIFFSRLTFDTPVEAFLLSPEAVQPDHQGRGIGQRLIRFGLERLKEMGGRGASPTGIRRSIRVSASRRSSSQRRRPSGCPSPKAGSARRWVSMR